ncbi:MAG TPA: uroporphyrinogen-III C-methyltransferase [Micromonosporaceae bacterium]
MSGQQSRRYMTALDLAGRRAVVVGGGAVAARRAQGLVDAGADVVVIAPDAVTDLRDLVRAGHVTWLPREYAGGDDLAGAWLVHTATGDRRVDDSVSADAAADRIWCVRADDAQASSAWTPAVARAEEVTVAVSAAGDPRRARAVRDAIRTALEAGDLPLRRYRPGRGHVALVGGGPGDPGLITVRGRRLLAQADVVVADRLAPRALLEGLRDEVLVIDVGKAPGRHPVPQEEINRILVEHALAGRRVVRLKGGDPYVLGRGGEELEACLRAGVDAAVVPGVTSAVSVPAAVGIPVTHRGLAKGFAVISGHEQLADAPRDATLVLLMGVSLLRTTAARLVELGRDPDGPVGIVEDGYGPRQRLTVATLATVADVAEERGVRPPAVVVVGDVVTMAQRLTTPTASGPGTRVA